MSGVFLDVSKLAHVLDFHKQLYYLNPMVNLIEAFRNVLMYNQAPNWQALAIITIFSLLGIWFGKYLIDKFEYIYPKVMP
jgi:lipopolysaccharide transport system permease protein